MGTNDIIEAVKRGHSAGGHPAALMLAGVVIPVNVEWVKDTSETHDCHPDKPLRKVNQLRFQVATSGAPWEIAVAPEPAPKSSWWQRIGGGK